jgi:hypothetical protein
LGARELFLDRRGNTRVVIVVTTSLLFGFAAPEDGGEPAQHRPVQVKLTDLRPLSERAPTDEEIMAALVQRLKDRRIPVGPNATTRLEIELLKAEKRDEEGVKACARVRSWIVESGREFLPKTEVVTERCVLTSQPKIPADGTVNWLGLANALSRRPPNQAAFAQAYLEALDQVVANLERRVGR